MKAERIKKGSTSFTPYSVASDGTNYYVHGVQRVYRDQGKRLVEVAQKNHDVNASQDAPNRQLNGGEGRFNICRRSLVGLREQRPSEYGRGRNVECGSH
jgi:hypothetical protein